MKISILKMNESVFFFQKSVKIKVKKRRCRFMTTLTEDLKKLILAGIGAAAVTAEKSKEMIDQLVEKGELTVEQGKVLNEELKHTIKEKLTPAPDTKTILQNLDTMSVEDLAKLKEKIEQLQKADNEE